jgi:hypothetical protein
MFATETDVLDINHPIIRFWWKHSPFKLQKFSLILTRQT